MVYVIDLLPALPKAWKNGSVRGLRARGGFEVDLAWAEGAPTRVSVRSLLGNPGSVRYGGKEVFLEAEKGETVAVKF